MGLLTSLLISFLNDEFNCSHSSWFIDLLKSIILIMFSGKVTKAHPFLTFLGTIWFQYALNVQSALLCQHWMIVNNLFLLMYGNH